MMDREDCKGCGKNGGCVIKSSTSFKYCPCKTCIVKSMCLNHECEKRNYVFYKAIREYQQPIKR